MDSPRRGPIRMDPRHHDLLMESGMMPRVDSPYTDLESNYSSCGGMADGVTSVAGDPMISWGTGMERCMSCISKLGAMSRSSTVTTAVPGGMGLGNGNNQSSCWEHTCDAHSLSSGGSDNGSICGWNQAVTKPPARPPKPSPTHQTPKTPLPSYENYDVPRIPYPVVNNIFFCFNVIF